MAASELGYDPAPDYEAIDKESLIDLSSIDSNIELWLLQCPKGQFPADINGQDISLKLNGGGDGTFASFVTPSGKSYELASFASQEPDATVFQYSKNASKLGMPPKKISKNSEIANAEGGKRDFSYCPEMEKHFLELCLREVNAEGHRGVSLSLDSWQRLRTEFNEKWKVDYAHKKIRNHYDQLRKDYELWRKMVGLSGHGHSVDVNTLLWPPEKWNEVIQQHPAAAKFRRKPLEDVETLKNIFEGTLAKGEVAWGPLSSGTRPNTSHSQVDEDIQLIDDETEFLGNPCDEFFNGVTITDQTGTDEEVQISFTDMRETENVLTSKKTPRRSEKKRKRNSSSSALEQQIESFVDVLKDQIAKDEASKGPGYLEVLTVLHDLENLNLITHNQFLRAKVLFCKMPDLKIGFMDAANIHDKVEFLEFVLES